VYLYAGISKIADTRFLDQTSPTSLHATLAAVRSASPIRFLLGPVADHTFAFGLLIAFAEIAVGIGIALGLLTRVAAVGGMVLALSLWLTVSWGAEPWYTSADLAYLFAFTPLLLAGAGGMWSLDELPDRGVVVRVRRRRRHRGRAGDHSPGTSRRRQADHRPGHRGPDVDSAALGRTVHRVRRGMPASGLSRDVRLRVQRFPLPVPRLDLCR
jgi:thiosulfate dehydrogenase [quinone] large subunit